MTAHAHAHAHAAAVPLRDFNLQPPRSHDRITFKTADDGELAGYVSKLGRHIGNGQLFAWVELDNALPGSFSAVLLTDVTSCDDCGAARRQSAAVNEARRLCLADYSGTLADQQRAVRAA
ncbi:hypothetical protein [Herbaspirillum frisingense]|uniref:hypothetical protein n=1 Tax=Herbaspirillum frisingense TaxID=92645 RepID=UPI0039B0E8F4